MASNSFFEHTHYGGSRAGRKKSCTRTSLVSTLALISENDSKVEEGLDVLEYLRYLKVK